MKSFWFYCKNSSKSFFPFFRRLIKSIFCGFFSSFPFKSVLGRHFGTAIKPSVNEFSETAKVHEILFFTNFSSTSVDLSNILSRSFKNRTLRRTEPFTIFSVWPFLLKSKSLSVSVLFRALSKNWFAVRFVLTPVRCKKLDFVADMI